MLTKAVPARLSRGPRASQGLGPSVREPSRHFRCHISAAWESCRGGPALGSGAAEDTSGPCFNRPCAPPFLRQALALTIHFQSQKHWRRLLDSALALTHPSLSTGNSYWPFQQKASRIHRVSVSAVSTRTHAYRTAAASNWPALPLPHNASPRAARRIFPEHKFLGC